VASAVNGGVPVSALKATEINSQLDAIARALAGVPDRPRRPERGIADESEDGIKAVRGQGSEFRVP
jgi:hypothetical protein